MCFPNLYSEASSRKSGSTASRVAAQAFLFKVFEVIRPNLILVEAKVIQILPAVNSSVVQIIKLDADGIISNWLKVHYTDKAPTGHNLFLIRDVALDFRRGAFDAQQFGRQCEGTASSYVSSNSFSAFRSRTCVGHC